LTVPCLQVLTFYLSQSTRGALNSLFYLTYRAFSCPEFPFDSFLDFNIFIEFPFHVLHCLPYFIHFFICILYEFIEVRMYVLFTWSFFWVQYLRFFCAYWLRYHVSLFFHDLVFRHWGLLIWSQVVS
jgi:hypothetical protein